MPQLTNLEVDQCANLLIALSNDPKTPVGKIALCVELLDALLPLQDSYKSARDKALIEKHGTQSGDGKFRVKTKEAAAAYKAELDALQQTSVTFKTTSKESTAFLEFINNWQLVTNAGSFDGIL